jgi:hypothetical protein
MKNFTIGAVVPQLAWAFCLFAVLCLCGCKADYDFGIEYLDQGYYLDRFNEEAKKRGLDFEEELKNIVFVEVTGYSEGEDCSDNTIAIPSIYTTPLPKLMETYYREQFIFHSLAHCLLGRGHDDSKLPNGEWKSLMRSEPYLSGNGEAIDFIGAKRDYYIAELFDPSTSYKDYFDAEPIPFANSYGRELVHDTQCGFIPGGDIPLAADDDYEVTVSLSGDEEPASISIVIEEDSSRLHLRYFKNTRRINLANLSDYGNYISHDFALNEPLPTADAVFTIRKVAGVFSIYLDGNYLFHRPADVPGKLVDYIVPNVLDLCADVTVHRLNI